MKREELIDMAKYIQFPYNNEIYKDYYETVNPIKLPIIKNGNVLYKGMPKDNGHHYTTEYTYKYVLPTIDKLLNFSFSLDDFNLINVNNGKYDLSYIRPKTNDRYTIIDFTNNNIQTGEYNILFNQEFFKNPLYRELYRYPHTCSKIVNETSKSSRVIMVSGDSQMIPSINPLTKYFKEVWYFDNRTGYFKENGCYTFYKEKFKSFSETYKDTIFTDVIIGCYCRELDWYEYWNLQ